MISKELLSKALGTTASTLRYTIYPNKENEPSEYTFPINIYELAHKCKEWAWKNKILLIVSPQGNTFNQPPFYKVRVLSNGKEVMVFTDLQLTEPEAIFKSCQWILDNTKD